MISYTSHKQLPRLNGEFVKEGIQTGHQVLNDNLIHPYILVDQDRLTR